MTRGMGNIRRNEQYVVTCYNYRGLVMTWSRSSVELCLHNTKCRDVRKLSKLHVYRNGVKLLYYVLYTLKEEEHVPSVEKQSDKSTQGISKELTTSRLYITRSRKNLSPSVLFPFKSQFRWSTTCTKFMEL